MNLTPPQARVLSIVRAFIDEHGYSPSTADIMRLGGWRSTASVHVHLHELRRLGVITYDSHKQRTIRIVNEGGATRG